MKNLMKSALCGNPAKFVWQETQNSNYEKQVLDSVTVKLNELKLSINEKPEQIMVAKKNLLLNNLYDKINKHSSFPQKLLNKFKNVYVHKSGDYGYVGFENGKVQLFNLVEQDKNAKIIIKEVEKELKELK